MIQELFGGSNVGVIGGERSKLSTPCGGAILDQNSPSPSPSSSSAAAAAAATTTTSENNLRCPRCDSSNTKFCYYNNYNLTQPRHFCKTCRRYWTKGGTLRNVPIGGGCRKSKTTSIAAAVGKSAASAKFKIASSEIGKTVLFGGSEHGESLSSNPIIWASSQNTHFLSSIRGSQVPNPIHQFTNSLSAKDEASPFGSVLSSRAFGPTAPTHLPYMGISNSSYRNQTLTSQGILHGEVQNHGLQEVYHRLRTASYCYPEHAPVMLGNMSSAASSTAILGSAPVATGELGFWSSTIPWPTDLPTINGAFPQS